MVETLLRWQTHWCSGRDTGALTLVDWWRHGGDTVETLDYGGDTIAVISTLQPLATTAQSNLT